MQHEDPNDPFSKLFQSTPQASPAQSGAGDTHPQQQPQGRMAAKTQLAPIPQQVSSRPASPPPLPNKLEATGLDETFVQNLILKCIHFEGAPRGVDIAHNLRLTYNCIAEPLEFLKKRQFVQVIGGGAQFGEQTMKYSLTDKGIERVSEALQRDNYYGPAPVPAETWFERVALQSINRQHTSPDRVKEAFSRLVLDPMVVERIGPAINSGRSLFLYGPPGNGKTSLAECITEAMGGEVYIPHAILAERQVVRIFDALYHEEVPEADDQKVDPRWVRCKRPVVMVGGELTLETLDLVRTEEATYYEAPFQLKATNGVLFIDDFGRQKCDPQDLLNRWIVPLESRFDFLTFHGGQKIRVPFDGLLVFSTNLDPKDLVDDAFLRRIRYKILVDDPSEDHFRQIWRIVSKARKLEHDEKVLDYLIENHYRGKRPFRACQPRDLIDQYLDIARYQGETPRLTPEIVDRLCALYFVEL